MQSDLSESTGNAPGAHLGFDGPQGETQALVWPDHHTRQLPGTLPEQQGIGRLDLIDRLLEQGR
jgi:hypothetical protein